MIKSVFGVLMKNCFYPAEILLPDFNTIDAGRWATVACDQFTSEPEYWEAAKAFVGDADSTLKLILPEVWLERAETEIPKINAAMSEYLRRILVSHPESMIYVERTQPSGGVRRGIVGMIDLECYDYKKGSESLIRATEGTVLERIPPRVAVRRGAEIELPHVMLLIDDPRATVIEPLVGKDLETAYDFPMMLDGGHIKGGFLSADEQKKVMASLEALVTPEAIRERYGDDYAPLLFAVGDGNHSLATAKTLYEEIKAEIGADAAKTHPARYALVEVVNLHDPALTFEPIYRVMFGVDAKNVVAELSEYINGLSGKADEQKIVCVGCGDDLVLTVKTPVQQLTVGTLQTFIDGYIKTHEGASVDYIHGEDSTRKLAEREDAIGFLFLGMGKSELFKTVILDGALPRKTFSMGHARDKRYYLEARKIKQ